jgi:hypothetical protein
MVGGSVDKKDEIRAYIKARSKLGCSFKQWITELSTAHRPSCVSKDTVRQWKMKFESVVSASKMHQNQVDQNLHLVTKSSQNK